MVRRQLALEPIVKTTFRLAAIKEIEAALDSQLAERLAAEMARDAYDHGSKWADKALRAKKVPVPDGERMFYLPPEQAMIDIFKERDLSEIRSLTGDMSTRLTRTLAEGYAKGETMNKLTARVREVTGFARRKATTIARTETLRAGNEAAKARYEQFEVDKVEFISAKDDRVCEECESLNGNIYNLDDAPDLPIHQNCRCTLIPHIDRGR